MTLMKKEYYLQKVFEHKIYQSIFNSIIFGIFYQNDLILTLSL